MLFTLLLRHSRPYAGSIAVALLLQLVAALTTLWLPSLNARIIDEGVANGDTSRIWGLGGIMLLVALAQGISAVAAVWFGARISMGIGRDLRRRVYDHVDSFGAQEISRFGTPSLITRSTNDVQQVQMVVLMMLNMMVNSPLMVVGGIVMAVRQNAGLSWLVWVTAPGVALVMALLMVRLVPLFTSMQVRVDAVNSVVREQIIGVRVVRAFVRERFETEKFRTANEQITDVSVRIGRLFVLVGPLVTVLMHVANASVLWFGGQRVDQGLMEVGSLTAFMQYLLQILTAVMMGSFIAMMLPRAIICARRIGEVLAVRPSVSEPEHPVRIEEPRGVVEFDHVTFSYPGAEHPVLQDVSFTASPGRTTALVGSTGAGKTTLVSLLPRLFDAASGAVRVDGVDVRDLAREQLAQTVGVVPQKPYLFSGTVASNLRFGRPEATDEELWAALETAQAADFVRERSTGGPEEPATGLDSALAQGGTDVSGGQRQRLCIARALVARPKVYVFDDSFSALDVSTDARLRRALAPVTAQATVLVVAQRVSTVLEADEILVLDAGRVVARGTHEQLLESSPTYQEIVRSQLQAEEAA